MVEFQPEDKLVSTQTLQLILLKVSLLEETMRRIEQRLDEADQLNRSVASVQPQEEESKAPIQ